MHQLIVQCLLQMFYESDSSSEFVFAESKSSYNFSILSDFSMVSVSSYLEYSSRILVQTDKSEKYSEEFRVILTGLGRRFKMPHSKDLNFENHVFRNLYNFFLKIFGFCKPIPQPSCCNLGSNTTKCSTPNSA